MRLKAKQESYSIGHVGLPCPLVAGGAIIVLNGFAEVEPINEDEFMAAMETGVFPLSNFRLAHPAESPKVRTTTILSTSRQSADASEEGLSWLAWSDALKVGYSAKALKEAALLGLVRTKEMDEKTVYCGEDLETVKEKRAR